MGASARTVTSTYLALTYSALQSTLLEGKSDPSEFGFGFGFGLGLGLGLGLRGLPLPVGAP